MFTDLLAFMKHPSQADEGCSYIQAIEVACMLFSCPPLYVLVDYPSVGGPTDCVLDSRVIPGWVSRSLMYKNATPESI